jgi:hypothetical protein
MRRDRSEQLAELYFELEQIDRTIAALEHFLHLRARRHERVRVMAPGLMRDALTPRTRLVKAPASRGEGLWGGLSTSRRGRPVLH